MRLTSKLVSNFVQTVGVIVATLVSAYAVGSAERNRRLDARRARVERVLDAVIRLADAAVHPHPTLAVFAPPEAEQPTVARAAVAENITLS